MSNQEDYVFFWKVNEVHGWGSQWFKSEFTVKMKIDGEEEEEVTFATAEHWMMVQKALLFKDVEMAREMLKVEDLAQVKRLGRRVANFDDDKWKEARMKIVVEGNLHKFRQNEELKAKLVATGEKRIIEASPMDRIWGIGFGEKNALKSRSRWGLNLLGLALEETRRTIDRGN
ncbi:DUF1768-domain-containing protein [Phlegmacium glaucopus]|nr:DUF1768-domain-containing protein [Phlegmacium glaucopus]